MRLEGRPGTDYDRSPACTAIKVEPSRGIRSGKGERVALSYLRGDVGAMLRGPAQSLSEQIQVLGSAFVVDDVGIAATAFHVVKKHFGRVRTSKAQGAPAPAPLYYLTHPSYVGDPQDGRVIFRTAQVIDARASATHDLALLQLAPLDGKLPLVLPLSTEFYEEGDELAICGWPFGLGLHKDRHKGAVLTASISPAMVSAVLPAPGAMEYRDIFFNFPLR
jgi:hypothetical protein